MDVIAAVFDHNAEVISTALLDAALFSVTASIENDLKFPEV